MKAHIKAHSTVKLIVVLILLSSAILPFSSNAQAKTKQQLIVPLSKPGRSFTLRLGLEIGNVKVIAHDGNDILVDAEPDTVKMARGEPNPNPNPNNSSNTNTNINNYESKSGKRNIIGVKYLVANESNNVVTLSQVAFNINLNVLVKVPKSSAALNLSIVYKGNILVVDVNGEIEINSNAGYIDLQNVSGSVVANNVAGNIKATFRNVDPKAPMAFSTLMGKIDVTFPSSFKANVKIQSDEGGLFSDYDILFEETTPKMNKVNTPPLYRTRLSGKLTGKINGGGAEILMKNMMGNIYIRKAT